MKKLILALVLPIFLAGACARTSYAQPAPPDTTVGEPEAAPTVTTPPPASSPTNIFESAVADAQSATNFGAVIYGTYAPEAPTQFGAGALAVYNFNNYVGAGLGLDWLGTFSLVSGNVTLKLPTRPLARYGIDAEFTPIALGGLGKPMSGPNRGDVCTIFDVGFYVNFGHLWGGRFNVGAMWGKWTGAGPYAVDRYHAFGGWNKGF